MPHAILLQSSGGPEQLRWQEIAMPALRPGEVLLRQEAVGVNFIDIYHRSGLYPLPVYPHGIGLEAAGVVEAVGQGVSDFRAGDRVAYARGMPGAYAEMRVMQAADLVPLPKQVDFRQAAAVIVKGLTAHYLLHRSYAVQPGDTILLHAAAGGVGLLMCQWAKQLGVTIIGTVSTEEKAALARGHGCDHIIFYAKEKVSARVRDITQGAGVNAVYDSVGQATFMDSLDALKPLGTMVSFGQSSGKVPPFDVNILAQKGSLFLTRPSLMHHVSDTVNYRAMAKELFELVEKGALKVHLDRIMPLKEAAEAHRLLEGRKTSGAIVLVP